MANNIDVKDAAAATQTLKTTDTAGVHTPHHNVDAVIPGTGATNLGKAEDAAHSSGDAGVMLLAVRKDTAAALAGTDADYIPLIVGSDGALWARLSQALPAGTNAIGKLAANSGVDIGDVDVTSIAAGENHLGEVGGSSITVTPTHTVDTAVYAAGDTVGTIITIASAFRASGKESILQSIQIVDRSNQKPTGNLLFFNASPAAATTTDNAAFVFSTDDLKLVARVPIIASDYVTINSKAVANLSNLGRQVYATTGTSLFVVFVTDGAPDFVATTDFQISYSFLRY